MGVPTLFKWLVSKYPEAIKNCEEEVGQFVDDIYIPPDISKKNPNGIEFDNFYIDMNGIIHNCSHNEFLDKIPETDDDMFNNMFLYLDRLFEIVRPRKLLYLAIDGVAPRAKMNQQRSRRFSAFQERQDRMDVEEEIRAQFNARGIPVPPKKARSWDSNQITPGTSFMMKVCDNMRYYIHNRITTNPDWKDVTVILSDGTVPGEGEHKIMDFIRRQRAQPGYNPNTTHIIHGLDADLIMLGLATHEAHFYVLREEVTVSAKKTVQCALCGQEGHYAKNCQGVASPPRGRLDRSSPYMKQRLQILHIPVLREYLRIEFEFLENILPFTFDLENIIDDLVLLCFLVGNDFLPHLPCLRIREGALELLFNIYKYLLPRMDGYFTSEGGVIDLDRFHKVFECLKDKEEEILRIRRAVQVDKEKRRARANQRSQNVPGNKEEINIDDVDNVDNVDNADKNEINLDAVEETKSIADIASSISNDLLNGMTETEAADAIILGLDEEKKKESIPEMTEEEIEKKFSLELSKTMYEKNRNDDVEDTIKLGEAGWLHRYYKEKFGKSHKLTEDFYEDISKEYVEGLQWIMRYYYDGCPSWDWFFPYHFAPCATTLNQYQYDPVEFRRGKPFRPLDQLMANQPPGCAYLLPEACRELMTSPQSPIFDFYPKRIEYDTNGLPFRWLWTALLPFIEKDRLIAAMDSVMDQFSPEEIIRNQQGLEVLCVRYTSELGKRFVNGGSKNISLKTGPIFGYIESSPRENSLYECVLSNPPEAFERVPSTMCLMLHYEMPYSVKHSSKLVNGVIPRMIVLDRSVLHSANSLDRDMDISKLWGSASVQISQQKREKIRSYNRMRTNGGVEEGYNNKRGRYDDQYQQPPQPYQGYPPQPYQGYPPQPYQGYPPQPYQGYPPQPYQGYPPQPYQGYPPSFPPTYPPTFPPMYPPRPSVYHPPQNDIRNNPLFAQQNNQPPANSSQSSAKKPFSFRG